MKLVERYPLRRLSQRPGPRHMPVPIPVRHAFHLVRARPPVPRQRLARQHVERSRLPVRFRRAGRGDLRQVHRHHPGIANVKGRRLKHRHPGLGQRRHDANERIGHRLAPAPVPGVLDKPLHGRLPHRRHEIQQHRHRIALGTAGRLDRPRPEQRIHHVPPQRTLGQQAPVNRQGLVHLHGHDRACTHAAPAPASWSDRIS